MKKKVLIASYDMEVGGVERSLISLLENIDYEKFEIDLMLYCHSGDFMGLLPEKPNLLPEIPQYTTFRKSIGETVREGHYMLGVSRILAKVRAALYQRTNKLEEAGYYQMQVMWKYSLPMLPKITKDYDIAISYLWPHYFVAEKVRARKKFAWIHTDYSTIETDIKSDLQIWSKFDQIIAVSEACKYSFLKKYELLSSKTEVIENITSPEFIRMMSKKKCDNPMEKDSRFKILTIARLSHAKGIDIAVEVLKTLKDKGYGNIVWYVVGYGGDEEKIKDLIKKYNITNEFILLGKQINPYPFLKACDLYVQPSRYEGKAVTVTEAKVLGKPVLITDYSTAKSQVIHGFDGYICDLSSSGLVQGIETLYNNQEIRELLSNNVKKQDYYNSKDLDQLYSLIG